MGSFLLLLAATVALAQQPEFEVASVKLSGPKSIRMFDGGPGTHDPSRISYTQADMLTLLLIGYDLKNAEQVVGPAWLRSENSERYDIVAKIPPGTSKDQFQIMLQNLLIERFSLRAHHETREIPVYALTVAKTGPKLKLSPPQAGPGDRPAVLVHMEAKGAHLSGHRASTSSLPRLLRSAVDKPIVDQTGLTGEYEIELDFSLDTSPALTDTTPPLSDLFRAIQQLGLRLEPKRLPMDVIVVDSANKTPSEN